MAKQFQAFAILGLVSGLICSFAGPELPNIKWLVDAFPGVVLGFFLFFAGRYVAHRDGQRWLSALLVTLSAAIIGWRLAVKVGVDSGLDELYLFAVCGAVGAGCVAIGLLYAWRIRTGVVPFVLITLLVGAFGGFIFHLIELVSGISSINNDFVWTTLLFTVWQTILFAGLVFALRYGSGRSS
ncbi:MAG: hypothetical protein OQL27_07405 [Sedimenticola sp.]|nr:hypothetical protein [Sedimenticola sp.]